MKLKLYLPVLGAMICVSLVASAAPLAAQSTSTGRVDFVALVAPSGGQPEPVRQMTFYLLRKSVEDIRSEAAHLVAGADLDQFIDSLSASVELKAWMHKHHSVRLSGEEFTKSLTPEEIVGTPEFFKAYLNHNEAFRAGFPEPKFKEKDKKTNPEKYDALMEQYQAAARKFIAATPETVIGMDLELVDLNPSPKWEAIDRKHRQDQDARAFQLAEQRYVAGRCDTDLDGHGSFGNVLPGNYWIGMFGVEAISGDVRLRWDYPVTVRRGETASVELSNLNAARPMASAQNSLN
jgi:hypothetical protein